MNQPGPGINPTHDLWEDDREVWLQRAIPHRADHRTGRRLHPRARRRATSRSSSMCPTTRRTTRCTRRRKYLDRFAHLPWDRRIMAAMISAVDDGVGDDHGRAASARASRRTPASSSRRTTAPRASRATGWTARSTRTTAARRASCKGHKFSLYEGGIRVPAILQLAGGDPAGQVLDEPCAAMDIFPTLAARRGRRPGGLRAGRRQPAAGRVATARRCRQRDLFWEMDEQTAMRRGPWKLVLNGQLVEGATASRCGPPGELADDSRRGATSPRQQPDMRPACAEPRMHGARESRSAGRRSFSRTHGTTRIGVRRARSALSR